MGEEVRNELSQVIKIQKSTRIGKYRNKRNPMEKQECHITRVT